MTSAQDRTYMAEALDLARRNLGATAENPSVGCVIVRHGEVVGKAVTAPGGRPHAEPQALAEAGEKARGATAYVTLEPCSHYGRTPPCADALIAAGIARVVVAVTDPDERVSGRGLAMLAEAGIAVETGVMEEDGRRLLAPYLTRKVEGRAFVTLKLAVSADGMIGRPGEEVAITGEETRQAVHLLRARSDAILVGIGTVLADDPELTVRIPGLEDRSPLRLVLDRELRLPLASKLVQTARTVPVLAVTPSLAGLDEKGKALAAAGVEVLEAPDLPALLRILAGRGLSSLMVEGGAQVARSFLDAALVDRVLLFQSPLVIGAGGLDSPLLPSDIAEDFRLVETTGFGLDRCFEYERLL